MASTFKHRPLDLCKKEIRLVRIYQAYDDTSPVRLTMSRATLSSDLKFNALSYAWGPGSPIHDVLIREEADDPATALETFQVRDNLHDFFLAARSSSEAWTKQWIWIDQLCIDQDCYEERCHQVAQMAELYSTARATVVWPGIMNLRNMVETTFELSPSWFRKGQDPDVEDNAESDCKATAEGSLDSLLDQLSDTTLKELAAKPYYTRLWVVQETCLASETFIFLAYGTATYFKLWVRMCALVRGLQEKGQESYDLAQFILHQQSRTIIKVGLQRWPSELFTWADVVDVWLGAHCTMPFDRVYGVMGMINEKLRLEPNYEISTTELLKRVLKKQIEHWEPSKHPSLWPGLFKLLVIWAHTFNWNPSESPFFYPEKDKGERLGIIRLWNTYIVILDLGIECTIPPALEELVRSPERSFHRDSLQASLPVEDPPEESTHDPLTVGAMKVERAVWPLYLQHPSYGWQNHQRSILERPNTQLWINARTKP